MAFRTLVMMVVLLGLWLGAGAPVPGIRISPAKPDPRIPTFAETVSRMPQADESADDTTDNEDEVRLRECQAEGGGDNCEKWYAPDEDSNEAPPLR
jgi:hypothetical protein